MEKLRDKLKKEKEGTKSELTQSDVDEEKSEEMNCTTFKIQEEVVVYLLSLICNCYNVCQNIM